MQAAAVCLVAVGAVVLLNLLVDPYGAYPGVGLGRLQEGRHLRGRRSKGELLVHDRWQVVLMGSSRVETALDPKHPAWGGLRVLNLGFNRYSAAELPYILDLACRTNELEAAYVGLDFFGFNALNDVQGPIDPAVFTSAESRAARQTAQLEFEESRFNPDLSLWRYHFDNLTSRSATSDSIDTIRRCVNHEPPEFTPEGFRVPRGRAKPPQRLFAGSLNTYLTQTHLYAGWRPGPRPMEAVTRMMDIAAERRVRLVFFIPPVHAFQMDAIHASGLWDAWEQWKHDVTRAVEEWAQSHPDRPAPVLWDFQGYNPMTTEAVPLQPDEKRPMKYYWESSHATREVGDRMIDRLAGVTADPDADAFGVRLMPANLGSHLVEIRSGREAYLRERPDQVELVRRLIAGARGGGPAED
jgi:hypothetical protein